MYRFNGMEPFIPLFILAVFNIISPKACFKVFRSWNTAKEPSPMYFHIQRIASIIVIVILILFYYTMGQVGKL